jgi:hypothetical protein
VLSCLRHCSGCGQSCIGGAPAHQRAPNTTGLAKNKLVAVLSCTILMYFCAGPNVGLRRVRRHLLSCRASVGCSTS